METERTLTRVLADLAAGVGDVKVSDKHEYSRSGTVFAVHPSATVVELRLGPEIAEAAARTLDTRLSDRGDAWIIFAPREWDEHAQDRLAAWYRVAWKLAERR
jgi:hypothetical protein